MKKLYTIYVLLLISFTVSAQYGYRDSNRIGITFGINQLSLNTKNFQTKPELGWNAGLSMRGGFYNSWDMVYAIQFSENNFSVATKSKFLANEDVNLKLASAQISLQLSYVLIENSLSIEFGPIVQVAGKFKSAYDKENNTISGTTLMVKDIQDISKFNFYPSVGLTAGVKHFRFNVSYQYGINNMLENLNSKDLGYDFKGNPGILNGNIILYL
jgi:hypothetical protein